MNRHLSRRTTLLSLILLAIPFRPLCAQQAGATAPVADPARLLAQFDADHDGRLSRDEAPERMRTRWDAIDADHDGFVTRAELEARDARAREASTAPAPRAAGGGFKASGPFSVITLGTGSPRYDAARSGPATVIQHHGSFVLVDMGNGTQAKLAEVGISMRQLDGLLLTHHHLDHNEEFTPLFINSRLMGAKPPIIGPPGTAAHVNFTMSAYAEDISYRMGRKGQAIADFQPIDTRELKGGESFTIGELKVTTAKVNHPIHTVAYRFDTGGQSIVISGDTAYSEALIDLARGADVLVIDSGGLIVRKDAPAARSGPTGVGESASHAAHATAAGVATMAAKAGVKRLVLTHIAPGEVDEPATIAAARPIYQGEVVVGRDLLETRPPEPARPAPPTL